ncbi:uncharacterized protein C17orf114 homolog isoform X2 [Pseudophryne corroboree]|uniref:uncharacterized protein C17orf114 homolog isoform X2 n=1 Tax=Pseudophryne corroboree TaxID=495146 RepID=UPI0030819DF4
MEKKRMGVKALQCFRWYGRRKERKRSKSQEETPAVSPQQEKPRLLSTNSVSSDTDGRAYFSGKARVSFRHEMDSTMNAHDSTY